MRGVPEGEGVCSSAI
ncbi:rCG26268 [Rattus norvegicus]|uniref:RCG26268 n=1 Tax=Rattus norvegicus TaxID=10116 RepID=A6HQG8_RAT|nr:rCG26268 [Rattus norvegicus]